MKKIENIELINFRCYENAKFNFKKGINIVVGNNAVGKTTLMESIYMIGMCKSFRTGLDGELIRKNKDFYIVNSNLYDDEEYNVVLSYSKGNKKIALNNEIYKSLSKHIGFINVIMFTPDDLDLIKGDPKYRRRFLDVNIGQLDSDYLLELSIYNKILKERNELLKQIDYSGAYISSENQTLLGIYNNMLIDSGKKVVQKREDFINSLNVFVKEYVKEISDNKEEGYIEYKPNSSKENFKEEFFSKEKQDLYTQTTNVGPHRDNFNVVLNGKSAENYGSQGQQRTLALAIKMALSRYMDEKKKDALLILDDVFGELDENRQNSLIRLIEKKEQVFVTTTSIKNIPLSVIEKSNIINI